MPNLIKKICKTTTLVYFIFSDNKLNKTQYIPRFHLHCLPILPLSSNAIEDHFLAPYLPTNSTTLASSLINKDK